MDTLKPLPDPVALRYVATLAEDAKKAAAEATAARAIAQSAQEEARLKDEEAKEKELVAEKKRITVEAAVQDALWMEPSKAKHLPIDPTVKRAPDSVMNVAPEVPAPQMNVLEDKGCAEVLMVQSLDYIGNGSGDGSIKRIAAARMLVKSKLIPKKAFMLWPQNGNLAEEERGMSLGENLANYCNEIHEFEEMNIIHEAKSWGTLDDIDAAINMIKDRGYKHAHFYLVTDPTHMHRVKLVWEKIAPEGWMVEFHTTMDEVMNLLDRLREIPAYFGYMWKLRKKERITV
jgi:hypothetical protein